MLNDWIIDKLNRVKKQHVVIVTDSLHILSQTDQKIQTFAEKNGYIVIFSSTNLVFRELLEHAREDPLKKKILLVDQTPIERRGHQTTQRAPPLFYPDFFPGLPDEAFIRLDLQTFLKEKTGDPNWPKEANERQYARLILKYLSGVLDAYKQLRDADKKRFTDQDFRTIVAFAALGLGKKAFQKLEYGDYWKIVFANHEEFKEIGTINHQILSDIKIHLEQAPKPFCWFATHDPDVVIRSLYLALVLSQYREDWRILLGNIDPEARLFSDISNEDLEKAARNLIDANADVADSDLGDLEDSFTNDDLRTLLIDWLHIDTPTGFSEMLQREKYSLLLRSFALTMAIGDVLSAKPDIEAHKSIQEVLFGDSIEGEKRFVDERKSTGWGYLKDAYWLATEVQSLKQELAQSLRHARTVQSNKLDFNYFWNIWNEKRTNRIEYYLSI